MAGYQLFSSVLCKGKLLASNGTSQWNVPDPWVIPWKEQSEQIPPTDKVTLALLPCLWQTFREPARIK
jgi:hypothetical protein